jgi:hypothetical protein
MRYESRATTSPRWARRWAWANRPILELDPPIKRYEVNRADRRRRRIGTAWWGAGRLKLRPAT